MKLDFEFLSKKFNWKDGEWQLDIEGLPPLPKKKRKYESKYFDDHMIDQTGLDGRYWSSGGPSHTSDDDL